VRFPRARRREAEITLTPLIDILFIVMLFLVLTATFTEQTVLRVSLPRAAAGETVVDNPSVVRVVVDADGRFYVNDRLQTLEELRARFAAIPDPDRARVMIAADRAARHGGIVQVLDLVRQAGIVRVEIQTLAESGRNGAR
jgi:biopolymer transport protein ExbD